MASIARRAQNVLDFPCGFAPQTSTSLTMDDNRTQRPPSFDALSPNWEDFFLIYSGKFVFPQCLFSILRFDKFFKEQSQ
jgi:hypothetical protein